MNDEIEKGDEAMADAQAPRPKTRARLCPTPLVSEEVEIRPTAGSMKFHEVIGAHVLMKGRSAAGCSPGGAAHR